MRFSFKIASRFLKSNKGQTFLIILGIAIGVSVQIFIGLLIDGLQKSLINKTIGNSSQITVVSQKEDKTIENWKEKIENIKKTSGKIEKISPAVDSSAFIKVEDKTEPILLRGFNLKEADKIYNIKNRLIDGKTPVKDNEVIIGKDLKKELGLKLNDNVKVITAKGDKKEVTIVGIYDLKVANINKSWVISNMDTVQNIFNFDNKITSIEIQVKDDSIFEADNIANNIYNALHKDKDIKVQNWEVQNEELLSGLKGQSISSIMIQVFVIIAVVLGIASVLAISVLQKSRQIGILKAMGIKDKDASLIFLFQGFILGILGSILGVVLGLTLAIAFSKFAVNPDGTSVVELYINWNLILISAIIAIVSSTLASLIPAIKSSKLNPIDVIKNN